MLKLEGFIPSQRLPNLNIEGTSEISSSKSRPCVPSTGLVTLAGERHRQECLNDYGLAGTARWQSVDRHLCTIVQTAREELCADQCTISIFDAHVQWVILAGDNTPAFAIPRSTGLSQHVFSHAGSQEVMVLCDALTEPLLADNPWVSGDNAAIRFFAVVPLMSSSGWVLGSVCMWSEEPGFLSEAQRHRLTRLCREVMSYFESQRALAANRIPTPTRTRRGVPWSIDKVIDEWAVNIVFQPVVRLGTGEVVGFEALARGPVGTSLESPMALFEAARRSCKLGELDWLCRVQAMNAAVRADLPPNLSWLLNVEPAGLAIQAPPQILAELDEGAKNLRIILELVERDLEAHVSDLLRTADQARRDSWGIALDDVGAEEGSLALLPFLHPDVVKLDMSLVRGVPHPAAASITAAVRACAESTGAVILAEGIETAEQERLAVVFGATLAQGYRYGIPGALPRTVPAPQRAIPLRQTLIPQERGTPFELLAMTNETHRGTKAEILHISEHLERQSQRGFDSAVLLAAFQDRIHFPPRLRRRYEQLSEKNTLTVVLANRLDWYAGPRYQTAPLQKGSRLGREWVVIVINPHYAAAFVARDCGDTGPDQERRFDFIYTHNRDAVILAGRTFLKELPAAPRSSFHSH